ncbi:ABC transporter permease [Microbacterium hydrocarbonoxydans]|uniref:ABC transporter permease n=1 Tax=Microbacterium hydrocarbonoxydans TaxID=273678 RepID=UPI00203BDA65|nr:ABC transporter permease [Microbacterium hydrocarbonoxydans]MCM3780778.1 ABC transporter permease [Microbacterium hydrocarbonoxydans]
MSATAPASEKVPSIETTAPRRSRWRRLHESGYAPAVLFVLLAIVVGVYDTSFFRIPSLMSLLEQSAPLIMLALAQGLVVLTGRITLAHAALASLAGVALAKALPLLGGMAVPAVLVAAAACGVIVGVLHVFTQVPSFIVTLGFLGIFTGLSLWISGADSVFVQSGYENVEWLSLRLFGVPISFLFVLAVAGILMVFMTFTSFGRRVRAIGLNERAAAFSGIPTTRIVVIVFAVSGALSGLAAMLQVAQLQSAGATTSDSLLLPSIAAVIVGGCSISGGVGGVGRMVMGALVIALLRVGLDLVGIDSAYQPILYGVIVILAIAATVDRRRGTAVA